MVYFELFLEASFYLRSNIVLTNIIVLIIPRNQTQIKKIIIFLK